MSPGRNDPGRERPPVPCLLNAQGKVSASTASAGTGRQRLARRRDPQGLPAWGRGAGWRGWRGWRPPRGLQGQAAGRKGLQSLVRNTQGEPKRSSRRRGGRDPRISRHWREAGQVSPAPRTPRGPPGLRPSVGRSPSSARGCGELCARSSPSTRQGEKERA